MKIKSKPTLYVQYPFFENRAVCDRMWKHIIEQATDNNMAQAHCTLDTYGYKYTLRVCNTG